MVPDISSATDRIFVILDHFSSFYTLKNPINQNFGKLKKKYLEIMSFYTNVPKIMIICYAVPEIRCMTNVILIFYLGYFLPFYPLNDPKNQNFKKMKKSSGDIIMLHMCTKNNDHMMYVPVVLCATDRQTDKRTDGQTDGQKK